MSKMWYRLFVFGIMIVLLGIGGVLGYRIVNNSDEIAQDPYREPVISDSNVVIYDQSEQKVTPVSTSTYDIEVVYNDYYTLCKETISDSTIHYGVDIDELKKEEENKQKESGKKYDILDESNERIVYKRECNTYCPNHFKIILEDGKVNVYSVITEDKQELYKTLEIPVETLRMEVKNELSAGILINSKNELKLIIEDIES